MTKEELKAYISEAVDALDPVDLEVLFPANQQPDLYSVVEELTGLKGTVGKLSGSTLKLNHEIHSLVEQIGLQQEQQQQFLNTLQAEEETTASESLDEDLKSLLLQLLEMEEVFQLAATSYQELPIPTWLNLNQYKTKLAAWQKGFDITLNRWQKLLQSTNLYKTGLVGELFNPELHEAVAVKHQNNLTDNTILETEQAGFLYKGQVLKLAKVVVNKVKLAKVVTAIPVTESTTINVANETVSETILELEQEVIEEMSKEVGEKQKPKPRRKKGRGGRRKKRKRKRK